MIERFATRMRRASGARSPTRTSAGRQKVSVYEAMAFGLPSAYVRQRATLIQSAALTSSFSADGLARYDQRRQGVH